MRGIRSLSPILLMALTALTVFLFTSKRLIGEQQQCHPTYRSKLSNNNNETHYNDEEKLTDCVIPAYGYPGYELKWILEVVLGHLPAINCSVLLRSDKQMGSDFRNWTSADGKRFEPRYPHVIIFWRDERLWEQQLYRDFLYHHSTMIQFGDESEDFSLDYYPYFKHIYRNYRGIKQHRAGSIGHLTTEAVDRMSLVQLANSVKHDEGQVAWWFPLGYSSATLSSEALLTPIWERRNIFFWAGQVATDERRQFVSAMEKDGELMKRGTIHTYGGWQQNLYSTEHLQPDQYTIHMYDASIVPCPSGGSPEQFRLSEALETGSLPMIKKGHTHLRYFDELGLRYIGLNNWTECTKILNQALTDQTLRAVLHQWQQNNSNRWKLIKQRVSRHFAAIIYDSVLKIRQ